MTALDSFRESIHSVNSFHDVQHEEISNTGEESGLSSKRSSSRETTADDEDIEAESESVLSSGTSSNEAENNGIYVRRQKLAEDETKAVEWSRVLMVLVLLGLATAAAVLVFKYTNSQEESDFEIKFTDFAFQMIGVYKVNAKKIKEIYENFALDVSSYAKGTRSTWPFVTMTDFEAKAGQVMNQTGSGNIALIHHVQPHQNEAWVNYTFQNVHWWKQESFDYHESNQTASPLAPFIFGDYINFGPLFAPMEPFGFFAPMWQAAPILGGFAGAQNIDAFHLGDYPVGYEQMMKANGAIMSEIIDFSTDTIEGFATLPESFILTPIYNRVEKDPSVDDIVGVVLSMLPWDKYFTDLLPEGINGIALVISDTCNKTFTFEVNGPAVAYIGPGDLHDLDYDAYAVETSFSPFESEMSCHSKISLYPSATFKASYESNKPMVYTIGVLCVFLLTVGIFFLYDCLVERRQKKVLSTAERSTAIVTSLFPQQVADKLMEQEQIKEKDNRKPKKPAILGQHPAPSAVGIKASIAGTGTVGGEFDVVTNLKGNMSSKPIAELFPSATVLFADIVGFTAWSSTREPSQVFELLEEIYSSFDAIARRKKVFKVETIGDCYMAATGLPEKRKDHALLMARFAKDCLRKMLSVVRKLELRLGPDTADLGMRVGIHSGPVTAGVLRGEKARFQLFGDTVNTAARMESTGVKNKIHLSTESADQIRAGQHKDIWTVPRKEQIEAKGKGKLQTHWLAYTNGTQSVSSGGTNLVSERSGGSDFSEVDFTESDEACNIKTTEILEDSKQKKLDRSVDWVAHNLLRLLKRVVAMRGGIDRHGSLTNSPMPSLKEGSLPLHEVKDIIELPSQEKKYPVYPSQVDLPPQVCIQLRDFVKTIASMYHANPFHSFEHAAHVTQSVTKLLTRVVTPNAFESDTNMLHQYTYGITSDPLAQFAVVFSALVHDVDHPGVSNATLVKEKTSLANLYQGKSVAEQNSVDIAWQLLSEPCYADLRSCIFTNTAEFKRFRQLVVNTVLATDIVDKELGAARKERWATAFEERDSSKALSSSFRESQSVRDANRKATIVIEHLIQASDVAHTMQHWHVYLKWNQRFFNECYRGYLEGRLEKDPSEGWYQGELGFFDYYVIPLAKKLKDCEVFGVASDEYLQYAEANRREWEEKGEATVAAYLEKYNEYSV